MSSLKEKTICCSQYSSCKGKIINIYHSIFFKSTLAVPPWLNTSSRCCHKSCTVNHYKQKDGKKLHGNHGKRKSMTPYKKRFDRRIRYWEQRKNILLTEGGGQNYCFLFVAQHTRLDPTGNTNRFHWIPPFLVVEDLKLYQSYYITCLTRVIT